MCRNIINLFNFDPPATDAEILASSLQLKLEKMADAHRALGFSTGRVSLS